MKKTLVGVNTLTSINPMAYNSHCQEWYRIGKDFPNEEIALWTPYRTSIDNMRNDCFKIAEQNEYNYLYFIDDDMLLTPGTYGKLRSAMEEEDAAAVMAYTFIRGYPFDTMAFIDPGDKSFEDKNKDFWEKIEKFNDLKDFVNEKGLVRCDAIGCATVLLNVQKLKEIPQRPLFQTINHGGFQCTEDVYMCALAQAHFGRQGVKFFVHTETPTGHILDPEVVWAQNVEKLRERGKEDCQVLQSKV